VLGLDLVGTAEDFFAAGGHSLLLVELQRRLEDELGREIPLVDLFRHRSVSAFARYLDREAPPEGGAPARHGSLVCLRNPEHPTRMLFLPALGGKIEAYLGLAAAAATDYGCHSAPVPGLRAGEPVHDSVQALAEHYVALLRDLQPHGPYHLTGWSFGGALAYETALQLERLGETVGLLAIVDTDLPDPSVAGLLVGLDHAMARMAYDWDGGATVTREELAGFTTEGQIVAHVARRLEAAGILYEHFGTADLEAVERAMRLEIVNFRAWTRYVPSGRYDGRLALLQTSAAAGEAPPGDLRMAGNGNPVVFRCAIPGTHRSILRAPQVERLAEALREALSWSRTTA
jgi:thioesterase domain-containing protein/acyl carrier protein